MAHYVVGVDEAGRGPLAGPVAVGVVIAPSFMNLTEVFPGVADSKTLSPRKRQEIFRLLEQYQEYGVVRFHVAFATAKTIDEKGITHAIRSCVYKGVRALAPDVSGHTVLLDGLLRAPEEYQQKTIVGGDATEPIISLASIVAKVSRDSVMERFGKQYPGYGFEEHKGYGTRSHHKAIQKLGLTAIHRKSYSISSM